MSLKRLHTQLSSSVRGNQISLNAASCGIPDWPSCLLPLKLQGPGTLCVHHPRFSIEDRELRVKGQVSLPGMPLFPVTVRFSLQGKRRSAHISITLSSDWLSKQQFLPLSEAIMLDSLEISQQKLSLVAGAPDTPDRGLQFSGRVQLKGSLHALRPFTRAHSLSVNGPITLHGNETKIDLWANIPGSKKLGTLSLNDFRVRFYDHSRTELSPQRSGIDLLANIQISRRVSIELSSTLPRSVNDSLFLTGTFNEAELPGLGDLAGLLGNDFKRTLPPVLNRASGLELDQCQLQLSPKRGTIDRAALSVRSKSKWNIAPGLLEIEDLLFELDVSSPLSKTRPQFSGTIFGKLNIAGAEVHLFVDAVDGLLYGTLAEDETISIRKLVKSFFPAPPPIPAKMTVDAFVIKADTRQKTFELEVGLGGGWKLPVGPQQAIIHDLDLNLSGSAGKKKNIGLEMDGVIEIAGRTQSVHAEYALDELVFTAPLGSFNLRELAEKFLPKNIRLPQGLPDFAFHDVFLSANSTRGEFTIRGRSEETWKLPIGAQGITIRNLEVDLRRAAEGPKKRKVIRGFIHGDVSLGGKPMKIRLQFPGDFVLSAELEKLNLSQLIQEFCDAEILQNLSLPASTLSTELAGLSFSIAPRSKRLSVHAQSEMGGTEFILKKTSRGKWGFCVNFSPSESWKLSSLDDSLKVLDKLDMSGTRLVLSSITDRNLALHGRSEPVSVSKGLNLLTDLDMKRLGVQQLLGVDRLLVQTAITGNPRDMVLQASIDGSIPMEKGSVFTDIKFRLQPQPNDFSVSLLGSLFAQLGDSRLEFIGALEIGIVSQSGPPMFQAGMQATMRGHWNDPLGMKGGRMSQVALDLGVGFPPIRPSLGIAGSLQLGKFKGAAAVKFDTRQPGQSMLAVSFQELYLLDIIQGVCHPQVARSLPRSFKKTLKGIGFEHASFYVVPQATNIGELRFERGMTLDGRMHCFGLKASAYLNFDYLSGVLIKAEVDPVHVAGLFRLTGAGKRKKALLHCDLRRGKPLLIEVSCAIELLGLKQQTLLKVTDQGFAFLMHGKIFDLFDCTIAASGRDLKNGGDLKVAVTMNTRFLSYMREKATGAIEAAARNATQGLTEKMEDLDQAQREVNRLKGVIAERRKDIQEDRNRKLKKLRTARSQLTRKQKDVAKRWTKVEKKRDEVRASRKKTQKKLSSARKKVTQAQRKVKSIQKRIQSKKNKIKGCKTAIKKKRQWYKRLHWSKKTWGWSKYAAYAAAKNTKISALYASIASLEASKHTAIGLLEAAKLFLRGLEEASKATPVDLDPRVAPLIAAHGTALAGLEVADQAVAVAELATEVLPIELDPRISGLYTALAGATTGIQTAKGALKVAKKAVGGWADVSTFIVDVGLGGLLDIRSASFECLLSQATSGHVQLQLEVVFMKKKQQTLALNFNFHDPRAGIKALTEHLLPG